MEKVSARTAHPCWSIGGKLTGWCSFGISTKKMSIAQFGIQFRAPTTPKLLTLQYSVTRDHLTARHEIPAKYSLPFAAQSEVTLTHLHITLTIHLTNCKLNYCYHHRRGQAVHTRIRLQRRDKANHCINMRGFIWLYTFGSCGLLS